MRIINTIILSYLKYVVIKTLEIARFKNLTHWLSFVIYTVYKYYQHYRKYKAQHHPDKKIIG